MEIYVEKIFHRECYQIAIRFLGNLSIKEFLKNLGAKYSRTFHCYYLPYNKEEYQNLLTDFDEVNLPKKEQRIPAKVRENDSPR